MLKFFKKMERTRNFIILLFTLVLVGSLVAVCVPTRDSQQQNLGRSTEIAAQVGSERITVGEVVTVQERDRQIQRQVAPANFLINKLIEEKLIRIEAEKYDVTASDIEIAKEIREIFKIPGKPFDQKRYEQNAIRSAGSVKNFEERIRNQVSRQKLVAFITAGVSASEEELLTDYKRRNTKFNLTYVPVNTADITKKISPTDEELKEYFEKKKKTYYINVSQKKIRYLYLETSRIGETLKFSDEALKEIYDKLPEDKKQAGVHVQEIVLNVAKPELDAQVLQKAIKIAGDLKKGDQTVSEEKFAEVAKGQSERPATAFNGGKVRGLVRENKNNPTDPYQRILNMKEGEITEPLKFRSSYYVLRRGKSVPKSFERAKNEIEVSRRHSKAYEATAALANKAVARLREVKDVQKIAKEFAAEANMKVSDMIRETGYVKPGDEIENLGISQDFEKGIASLVKVDDVGDRIPIPGGFAIPLLVDKKDPRDAELKEVRSQVLEAVKNEQAREQVEKIAKKIAASANSAGDLRAAAQNEKLKARNAKDFILGSPLGEGPSASTSRALEDAIFDLKKGEITKTPIKIGTGDDWLVIAVNTREEADIESFAKERDQLVRRKIAEKRFRVFSDYIGSVRQTMQDKGEIKIFKEAIDKIDEQSRQNQPQLPPQIPQLPQFPGQPGKIPLPPPQ